MTITAKEYEEMLEDENLSPLERTEFQYRWKQAEKREALLAKLTERGRLQRLTLRWQQESLRVLHQLLAKQFEVEEWERRLQKPLWVADARNTLERKRRGMQQRIERARREGAGGCLLQTEWLARHAELVAAVSLD